MLYCSNPYISSMELIISFIVNDSLGSMEAKVPNLFGISKRQEYALNAISTLFPMLDPWVEI